eukprot:12757639-Ditylum_brightwellii.AAC.1
MMMLKIMLKMMLIIVLKMVMMIVLKMRSQQNKLVVGNKDDVVEDDIYNGVDNGDDDSVDVADIHLTHLSQEADCHLTWRSQQNKHNVGNKDDDADNDVDNCDDDGADNCVDN